MSDPFQQFLSTVETDLKEAVVWVEHETEDALTFIWTTAKPLFVSFEPTLVKDVLTALIGFLGSASADVQGGNWADIEVAFLQDLEGAGSALFADAQTLGSTLLQTLIGLAKGALPKS